jgi:hypothetical protein
MRWLEVAPPGSTARLALNPPMGGQPGGGSIGVETVDVLGEHARLTAIGGVDLDPAPMRTPGAPLMFMLRDPDGNVVVVVRGGSGRVAPLVTGQVRQAPTPGTASQPGAVRGGRRCSPSGPLR